MGKVDPPSMGLCIIHRFCVIHVSAGETGKSCGEFPGARPAYRGTPETPADNIGRGCSVIPNWVRGRRTSVRDNRTVCAEDGYSLDDNMCV